MEPKTMSIMAIIYIAGKASTEYGVAYSKCMTVCRRWVSVGQEFLQVSKMERL